jgi:hypothetical protein
MPKHNKHQYSLTEVYTHYKKSVTTPVDQKVYKLILDTWGKIVNDYLLAGKDVKLQQGLSTLGVRKKERRTYIDAKESKAAGRAVVKSNSHSGFYGARIYWRRHYTVINSIGWEFRPTRALSRALGVIMKMPLGHTTFVKRALVTRDVEQSKSTYNKKVHKI